MDIREIKKIGEAKATIALDGCEASAADHDKPPC